jgi:uncharacterized protein YciI
MAQFLYRIQPVRAAMLSQGPTSDEEAVIAEHFEYLMRLAEEGTLILAGRTLNTDRSSFGIVLLDSEGEDRARELMMEDPAVSAGVFTAELFPFRVAVTPPPPGCGDRP